jgi:hypothetical protein
VPGDRSLDFLNLEKYFYDYETICRFADWFWLAAVRRLWSSNSVEGLLFGESRLL